MAQKFQYDESGSTFFYFLLSFLALILIPTTIYYWPREKKRDPDEESKKCHCLSCIKKREFLKHAEPWKGPKNLLIKLIIVVGWLILLFLTYKVSQFKIEIATFDPYEILGVPSGASEGEIKKAYRKLSLILHPDKDTGNEKEFVKLSKAYKALTDDEARENWEKYGNPDGPGAMSFGIALPSWIVEKENSVWVLGFYALVFMVVLPTVVGTWWYRSIRYTGDQVLLETTKIYYYFFHKTPNMPLKRVIMILAASYEFNKHLNSEIIERHTDNEEVPQLIKHLPSLSEKNKEKPLCYPPSIKARALIHAHLSRIPLNPETLENDRRYVVAKCPYLIREQIHCFIQLLLSGYPRMQKFAKLETIENCMKLCAMIIQGLWDTKSPLLQLPHINDDNLKYFMNKKKSIKSLKQCAQLKEEERRNILRNFSNEEYDNVMKVLGNMPYIDFQVEYEVLDDEKPTEVTAGSVVTVIVTLIRRNMSTLFDDETVKDSNSITENIVEADANTESGAGDVSTEPLVKRPVWLKQKRGGAKKTKRTGRQTKPPPTEPKVEESPVPISEKKTPKEKNEAEESEESDVTDAETNDKSSDEESAQKSNNEDDDQEWEKFKTLHKREKAFEGKSKSSHPVHCPFFPTDKQEYWWMYICDRKTQKLSTMPHHVTSLVEEEVVDLKFTAPETPGVHTFTVCIKSDSYLGFDQQKDIKLDVKEAPAKITQHPQWEFDDSEEEDPAKEDAHESDYATDEDVAEDDD